MFTMEILLTKHKHYARIVFMFPDKYKHHSRQPKGLTARLTSKLVTMFKREAVVADANNGWMI